MTAMIQVDYSFWGKTRASRILLPCCLVGAIGLGPWIGWLNAFLPAVSVLLGWGLRFGLSRTGWREPRRYMLGFPETEKTRVALLLVAVSLTMTVAVLLVLTPRHGLGPAIQLASPLVVISGLTLLIAVACASRASTRAGRSRHKSAEKAGQLARST